MLLIEPVIINKWEKLHDQSYNNLSLQDLRDQLHCAMNCTAILQLPRYQNISMLFQIIVWMTSPPNYHILYCQYKTKIFMVLLEILYKIDSHLAWVNGIDRTCRSKRMNIISILLLKGKFVSRLFSEVRPRNRVTTYKWNC